MRICCTADLHMNLVEIPECDLLLIAGDICDGFEQKSLRRMEDWMNDSVDKWLKRIPAKTVIFTPGNHDFLYQVKSKYSCPSLRWEVLIDEAVTIYDEDNNPIKVYGTPWQKRHGDWAFNADEAELPAVWAKIPSDTDILLTHMPPAGAAKGGNVALRDRINEVKPKLVVCGHYHGGFGIYKTKAGVPVVNAALVDTQRRPSNYIVKFDYKDGKLVEV